MKFRLGLEQFGQILEVRFFIHIILLSRKYRSLCILSYTIVSNLIDLIEIFGILSTSLSISIFLHFGLIILIIDSMAEMNIMLICK